MYVDHMSLDDAREWEEYLESLLDNGAINHPNHEQLTWDLEDVRQHIGYLMEKGME